MTDPKTSKTPEFLVQHVKFVSVATRDPEAKLIEILKACRGVRVLANWVFYLDSRAMRELFSSSDLSPTRLCVSAEATEDVFFQVSQGPEPCLMDLSLPIFQNLTHLELICASEDGWKYWDGLSLLSNLTHLSVDHGYFHSQAYIEVARKILFQCPASLRVFVFWVPSRSLIRGGWKEVYAINKGNVDPRAVVASTGGFIKDDPFGHPEYALCRSHPDTERDWKGKTTGKDFWELAEEIIERRRKWLQEVRQAFAPLLLSMED
ncbi:hypothetical protein EST38_g10387 [Candolleomyces aberdarensis]|uniref:Uncharacterized protein n=1 Tax=Candolleomyces aberdarensis TaxID=2316362 RepID=A0A4Q2D9Y2_9AGAR|nr:hypothetical protein EST38_g10387 [Candolleomyces aberdarensis]